MTDHVGDRGRDFAGPECRRTMKVCHFTSVHNPYDTRILYKECMGLAGAGHEVHLVAVHDRDEVRGNVRIHGVRRRNSLLKRMLFTTRDVYRTAREIDADVYHFHDPELMIYGLFLKLAGKKVICDVHEDFPDYIRYKDAIPRPFRRPAAWFTGIVEWFTARFFDAIIVVTPKILERFRPLNERTVMIRNFPLLAELSHGESRPWGERSDTVIYVGSLTLERGIREMVQAAALARSKGAVRFILGGRFPNAEVERDVTGLPEFADVDYRGFMMRDEVVETLADVKAGLVAPLDRSFHRSGFMTKLYEYMSAGIPVIASDFPLWREIIGGARCGIMVEPGNVGHLADAIRYVLDHPMEAAEMGRNGRAAVEKTYNWERQQEQLFDVYRRLSEG